VFFEWGGNGECVKRKAFVSKIPTNAHAAYKKLM